MKRLFKKLSKRLLFILSALLVAGGGIFLYGYFHSKSASAAWMDENWSYRQTVALTNAGSNQTDYQVSFTLDTATLITAGKTQSDCDDIRITDINGKLLPHWIQTSPTTSACNQATTKIWTKVPSVTTSGATIYVYYGNPSAGSIADGNKVFQFFDDFSKSSLDTTKWATSGTSSGTLQISSNKLNIAQTNANSTGTFATSISSFATPVISETSMTVNSASIVAAGNWMKIRVGASGQSLHFKKGEDVAGGAGGFYYAYYNAGWSTIGNSNYAAGNTKVIKTTRNGSSSEGVYEDGVQVGTSFTAGDSAGAVALGGTTDTGAAFDVSYDWVFTRKYAATEPSAAAPASEEQGPGPVAYWKFDDGQGTSVQDATSSNLDGTISGPAWTTENQCISGKCLNFTLDNNPITITNGYSNTISGKTTFAVEMWIKMPATFPSEVDLFGRSSNGDINAYIDQLGIVTFQTDLYNPIITSAGEITANKWYHLAFVKTGATNGKIYINGVQKSSGTLDATPTAASENLTIGDAGGGMGAPFNGYMDEVKIYNQSRTAAQIYQDYASGAANAGTKQGTSAVLGSSTEKWLSDGLVSYWKMDDNVSGDAKALTDSSGNSAGGTTHYGANTTGMDCTVAGKYGGGCSLDGADDYMDGGSNFNYTSQNFSISYWIKLNSLTTNVVNQGPVPIYKGQYQVNGYYSQINASGGISFVTNQSGANQSSSAPAGTITTGNWYQITYARNGASVRIYVNGVDVTSSDPAHINPTSSSDNFQVGLYASTINTNGYVDDLRIYNRALSPKEVSDLYNWAPGPSGYWNFEEGSGTAANDTSGNANNGTITAGTGSFTTGKYGKGYNFDNASTVVNTGSGSTLDALPAVTAEAWIKPAGLGENSAGFILAKNVGTTPSSGWILQLGASNALTFTVDGSTDLVRTTATNAFTTNAWSHIAVTWDGVITTASSVHIYVNGVEASYATTTNGASRVSDASSTLYIGNDSTGAATFNGVIDDVKVYNYQRTQKQIVQDMNAGHPAVGSPVGSALGYWKFDEGADNTCSGGANDACNSGSGGSSLDGAGTGFSSPATTTSGWTQSGKFGRALLYDGTDDRISITDSAAISPTTAITLSAWVKVSVADDNGIFGKYVSGSNRRSYLLGITGNKPYFVLTSDGTNGASLTGNTTISLNTWYHIAATYDGSNMTLYVNGKYDGSKAYANGIYDSTDPLLIGDGDAGSWYFNGAIDEAKLYNYALTADEIKTEYNRGSSLVLGALSDNSSYQVNAANQEYCIPGDSTACTAPVGRWDFEEGSGISTNDTSGNGYIGTITNATWTTGKVGKALSFDGNGDFVDAGDQSGLEGLSGMTIEAWINPASLSVQDDIVQKENTYNFRKTSTEIECWVHNGTAWVNIADALNSSLTANTWANVACTWTAGGSGKIYVNGKDVSVNILTQDVMATNTNNVRIGSRVTSEYFQGKIDQVRIYNYARSAAQVAWDYNKGGPVGWWKFDECQGVTANDSSGNSNSGTITIGASGEDTVGTCTTSSTAWGSGATGKRNSSLSLDGTDDRISVSGSTGIPTGNTTYTISAWIKPTSYGTYGIVGWGNWGTNNQVNALRLSANGLVNYWWGNDLTVTVSGLTDGNWHHVVALFDGTTRAIYVDGRLINSDTPTSHNTTFADFNIGRTNSTEYFPGQIDDVKIFNYALTATQVRNIMNDGAIRFGPSTGAP